MMGNRSGNSTFYNLIEGLKFYLGRLRNKPALNPLPGLACLVILFSLPSGICAETFVSGNITQNTTWTLDKSPYIVTGDVTVRYSSANAATAALTIEPGVVVRFEPGTGLYIGEYRHYLQHHYGALIVQGTEAAPITFTSNATIPAAGDWKGIYFRDQTDDTSTILEHCVVEYGGDTHNANLYFASASPTVKTSTVRFSSGYGIYSDDASSGYIIDNFFPDNATSSISVHPAGVNARIGGNSGSGSSANYISVREGMITSDNTWSKNQLPYVIEGDVTVRYSSANAATAALTIEPGVVVRFEPGTGLYIGEYRHYLQHHYGALIVQGTEAAPITFTSNATIPAPGDWKGIYFRNQTDDSATLIEYCIFEYGGHTNNANLYLENAKPTIQYNTIRNSSHSGIYVTGSGSDGATIQCLYDQQYQTLNNHQ